MRVLAVETSCDETAAAVVLAAAPGAGFRVASSVVASQAASHAKFGGVVPELATREHLRAVEPVVRAALDGAGCRWPDLDAVCATRGPGLASSLLVGHTFAKAAALAAGRPFLGVNHLEGHLWSPFLDPAAPAPETLGEWISLVASGGHTLLLRTRADLRHELLGGTRDDAAGEAFDKGAKLLGLGYPGGPALERAAEGGNPAAFAFPIGLARTGSLEFSFSGLKTALRVLLERHGPPPPLADVCASYQAAIVRALAVKTAAALEQTGLRAVTLSGGVACNRAVRAGLASVADAAGARLLVAPAAYCTDNAAMIAAAGLARARTGAVSGWAEDIDPNLRFMDVARGSNTLSGTAP